MRTPRLLPIFLTAAALTLPTSAHASSALNVTITSGPSGTVATSDATFTFTANEPASFRCSLDGAALAACSSPKSYTSLADGRHTFTVQATNRNGAGTPFSDSESRDWTIDRSSGPPDYDGDGLTGNGDLCPNTPAGLHPVARGCSAVEIGANPSPFGRQSQKALREMLGWLHTRARPFRKGLKLLGKGKGELGLALVTLGDGSVCPASQQTRRGALDLGAGERGLLPAIQSADRRLLRNRSLGDVGPGDVGYEGLHIALRLIHSAEAQAELLHGLTGLVCNDVAGRLRTDGSIASIDDARGLLTLADGRTFAMGGRLRRHLVEGERATLIGVAFKDGGGIVTDAIAKPGLDSNGNAVAQTSPGVAKVKCMSARIAPFQPFNPPLPFVSGPYTLHRVDAYNKGGTLQLETGMRVGVVDGCKPPPQSGPVVSTKYTVRSEFVHLTYFSVFTHKVKSAVLADELTGNDTPVGFPSDIDASAAAKLILNEQVKTCTTGVVVQGSPPPCGKPTQNGNDQVFDVQIRPFGTYAKAVYDRTQFELDTKPAGSFQPAKVTGVTVGSVLQGKTLTFAAQGYKVSGNGTTRPNVATIGKNQQFGVFLDDFFDPDVLLFYPEETTGVDRPGGLMWPHVTGKRNGHNFSYAVRLPKLNRDRVNACSGIDSYYRLPFAGVSTWYLAKGNFDDPGGGHAKGSGSGNDQRYAFDWTWEPDPGQVNYFGTRKPLGNTGAEVRAARPGVVYDDQTGEVGNSIPSGTTEEDGTKETGPVPPGYKGVGNFVVVKQADGTFSSYWHLKKDSVVVAIGDKVKRGQKLALSGNTGSSFSPHMHWDVRVGWALVYPNPLTEFPSKRVKVQDANHTCWIPRDADTIDSNNVLTP